MNWKEIDGIKMHHEVTQQLIYNSTLTNSTAHEDRGQLLEFLDQFRPHPFDPEDRGTWPEEQQLIILRYKSLDGRKTVAGSVIQYDSENIHIWGNERIIISVKNLIWWMNLPPGMEE